MIGTSPRSIPVPFGVFRLASLAVLQPRANATAGTPEAVRAVETRGRAEEIGHSALARRASASGYGVDVRLVALVRSHAPLRRALAAIAARLVGGRASERLGFARLRDYAAERAGMSARQVQELAHMDAVFAQLPLCEAAFLAGALSWTQARLIARVATPGDEAGWIALAQRRTARALAREVRGVDAAPPASLGRPTKTAPSRSAAKPSSCAVRRGCARS